MNKYDELANSIINNKGLVQKIIKNGKRVGTLVAYKFNDEHFAIGYSLCNPSDRFNKFLSLHIAFERALKDIPYNFPCSIMKDVDKFIDRAERYYKTQYEG